MAGVGERPGQSNGSGWRGSGRWRWLPSDGWLVGSLLLGLVVRLAVWLTNRGYEPFGDEQYYYRAALLFAQTGQYYDPPTPAWLPVQRVPLLSLLTGLLFRLFGADLGPVNLVQIAISLTIVWLVGRLAHSLWGRWAGRWGLVLAALYPTLITHPAAFLYTETLYAAGCLAALAVLAHLGGLTADATSGEAADQSSGWPRLSRQRLGLALLAGLLIGLTALTRSSAVLLLAVTGLWLLLSGWRDWRTTTRVGLAILLATALTIAPWTVRNYQTYGGLLVLDTIGAYNLWRDNALPGENPAAVLVRLSNPIEQQRVATERGLASLLAAPERFLAKLPNNALYLWHLELDSYARGGGFFEDLTNRNDSIGLVLAADLAQLVVGGLALLGLTLAPWRRGRTPGQRRAQLLLTLWIVANLLSGIVLHSESRFRIAYQPALIVFAVLPLVARRAIWLRARRPERGILAASAVLWLLAGAWSPRLGPVLAMEGWTLVGRSLEASDRPAALTAYRRATEALPTSDRPLISLAEALRRAGERQAAIDAYRAALERQPHSVNAAVPLSYLYLESGQRETAQAVLRATGTSDTDLVGWSWRNIDPPPIGRLDLGSSLDIGYVTNVYPPERVSSATGPVDFRWTNGSGVMRLTVPAGGVTALELRFNGTRLSGAPASRVEVRVNGRSLGQTTASGDWQVMRFDLTDLRLTPGTPLLVEVNSDTFVPSAVVAGNRDGRRLGLAIDQINLLP